MAPAPLLLCQHNTYLETAIFNVYQDAFNNNLSKKCIAGFVPTLNLPHQTGFVPTLNQPLQNRLCACSKTRFVPSLNLLHQNRLCAYAQPAAPKLALHRHLTCLFILNKYFDCIRGKVWLSGFGFSSPYRGFNLSIWYYTGFVLTRFGTNPVL